MFDGSRFPVFTEHEPVPQPSPLARLREREEPVVKVVALFISDRQTARPGKGGLISKGMGAFEGGPNLI